MVRRTQATHDGGQLPTPHVMVGPVLLGGGMYLQRSERL